MKEDDTYNGHLITCSSFIPTRIPQQWENVTNVFDWHAHRVFIPTHTPSNGGDSPTIRISGGMTWNSNSHPPTMGDENGADAQQFVVKERVIPTHTPDW